MPASAASFTWQAGSHPISGVAIVVGTAQPFILALSPAGVKQGGHRRKPVESVAQQFPSPAGEVAFALRLPPLPWVDATTDGHTRITNGLTQPLDPYTVSRNRGA